VHHYRGQLGLNYDESNWATLLIDSVLVKLDRAPPT